jgi:hypothetical protein
MVDEKTPDKATGRVVAVIVLLIAIAASLRGYLPGVERANQPPPDSGSSPAYVAAMITVSLVIVAVAFIARLRDPRRAPASAGALPNSFSGGRGRPAWRVLMIGAGVLLAWLLLAWVLSRFIVLHSVDQPQAAPQSTAVRVLAPGTNAPQRPRSHDSDANRDVLPYLIAGTVALLTMIVAGAVVAARRRRVRESRVEPVQTPGRTATAVAATSLARAAESGLAEITDLNHEPRQAIIACYAAMERELTHFPDAVPQDFDTPTEVLARAVEHHALHAGNAAELVNLFEEARFSPHVMNEAHRTSALRVLQLVLADMRSPV